jgi:hypothetical protein
MTIATTFRITLPEQFRHVPNRPGAEFDSWARLVATERTSAGSDSTISTDLERLAAAMDSAEEPDQHWFIAVAPSPYQLGIAAFGWMSAVPAQGVTAEALANHVPADGIRDGDDSLVSRASLHQIGPDTALIINQLQPVEAGSTTVLIERCGALLLVAASDILVQLELVAPDMRAFDDIIQTAVEMLESVTIANVKFEA